MIEFKSMALSRREQYNEYLMADGERGCEYSFTNLYLWGRQKAAFLEGRLAFFSHFYGRSVYPFPIGPGELKPVLDAIFHDAEARGIPCRLTSLTKEDCLALQELYPGRFRFRQDRDSFDYVYDINDLADLAGRKLQRKRNHVNRFFKEHPDARFVPLTAENLPAAREMVRLWFLSRIENAPQGTYLLEQVAMGRAFDHYEELALEGGLLMEGEEVLAVTMGSRLSANTFDIHFEKARDDIDGAYAAVNREFARYLRQRYPELEFLNREDDLGLEGLRKAKLSYCPHHMVEKYWAYLAEEEHEI